MAKYKSKADNKEVETKENNKTKNKKNVTKNTELSAKKVSKQINKTIKKSTSLTETQVQVRNFVIILLIIVALVVALYFISAKVVDDRTENTTNNTTTDVDINYSIATVGMILNRPYEEYYVMVYDSSDDNSMYYASLITNYSAKDDSLKIYFVDLDNTQNKAYKASSETGNVNVTDKIEDFSFANLTLLKVSKGKVVSYLEGLESIENTLK